MNRKLRNQAKSKIKLYNSNRLIDFLSDIDENLAALVVYDDKKIDESTNDDIFRNQRS